jgi:hypothetical protein
LHDLLLQAGRVPRYDGPDCGIADVVQELLPPGLVMEAIPGVGVIPFLLLVVGAIAVWGTVRPHLK